MVDNDEDKVREQIAEHYRALAENDREATEKTLHKHFIFLAPWGKVYRKEEYLDHLFNQKKKWELLEEPTILAMEILAPTATAVFLELRGTAVIAGKVFEGAFRASHTLVKTEEGWLYLACDIVPAE